MALGLASYFEEVWPSTRRPTWSASDAAAAGWAQPISAGLDRPVEALTAPLESFELVTVGNAFHRLPRQLIAAKAYRWLSPRGCFALLWGGSPWQETPVATGGRPPRSAAAEQGPATGSPPGWEEARTSKPDLDVLREAGFEILGRFSEPVTLEWSFESVVGNVYFTSTAPPVLGGQAANFEADLHQRLVEVAGDGPYVQQTEFAGDLGRRP